MQFEFATASRIIFGSGKVREIGAIAKTSGQRALLVSGRNSTRTQALTQSLLDAQIVVETFSIPGEPTTALIQEGTAIARRQKCDFVIGFGGGSALDAAKAIAALITNPGDLFDYLEVIGKAKPLANPSAPCIAIPTTSGTGAEVTKNAVLASPEHQVKVSMRSPFMLPVVALIDPELTLSLPPAVTASTGMDALTQLIEPFVCLRANPLTDAFCREGITRVARALPVAFATGNNLAAREDMAMASLLGGLALANAGLGAAHGFAAPIGGMFDAPHGAICAALLPHVMEINIRALHARAPGSMDRYNEVAKLLTARHDASAAEGVEWVRNLVQRLQIPGLKTYGIKTEHVKTLVSKAASASSMKANPILLTTAELEEILTKSL